MEALQARIVNNRRKIVSQRCGGPHYFDAGPLTIPANWKIQQERSTTSYEPRRRVFSGTKAMFEAALNGVRLSTYRNAMRVPHVVGKRVRFHRREFEDKPLESLRQEIQQELTGFPKDIYQAMRDGGFVAYEGENQPGTVVCVLCAGSTVTENCNDFVKVMEGRTNTRYGMYWNRKLPLLPAAHWHQSMSVTPHRTIRNLQKLNCRDDCRLPRLAMD